MNKLRPEKLDIKKEIFYILNLVAMIFQLTIYCVILKRLRNNFLHDQSLFTYVPT